MSIRMKYDGYHAEIKEQADSTIIKKQKKPKPVLKVEQN